MNDSKLTNPKDHFGSAKIDAGNVPDTLVICAARAFLEGALKYGRFNWRIAGVRASIYHAALRRHLAKWWNGQNADKKTRIHHLDSAIACLAILRDAELYGKLNDDRPPCPNPDAIADMIDSMEGDVAFLRDLLKEHSPKQYTIADTGPVLDYSHELPLAKKGDAGSDRHDTNPSCGKRGPEGYWCCLSPGHAGQHEASNGTALVEVWPA